MTASVVPNIPPPLLIPIELEQESEPRVISDYSEFERHKFVDSRKKRPAWAKDAHSLMQHVLSPSLVRRWKIAYLYWLQNRTARDIAEEMGISTQAVKDVLRRMRGR